MSTPLSDLESEAMKLPREERARLAERLLASVYGDPDIDAAWAPRSSAGSPRWRPERRSLQPSLR